jgi:Flp pilus assembly protein TadG
MMRLLGADDRGAIGVLVGMLLATGVLLGMAALTVDVGMLYQERAELQNGADAASIAVSDALVGV